MYFEIKENEISNNKIKTLFEAILGKPISRIEFDEARHALSLFLRYDEFAYLKYDFDGNTSSEKFISIANRLKTTDKGEFFYIGDESFSNHQNLKEIDISYYCNRLIYLGTNDKKKEIYSNFKIVNNLLAHGDPETGKSFYLKRILKDAISRADLGRFDYIIWSIKPSEFKKEFENHVVEDAHTFLEVIKQIAEYKGQNTLVIIDELYLFLELLHKSEKEEFYSLFYNSNEYNLCFASVSQNMSAIMYDLEDGCGTTICFGCDMKENAYKMRLDEDTPGLKERGEFYINNEAEFLLPRKMKV